MLCCLRLSQCGPVALTHNAPHTHAHKYTLAYTCARSQTHAHNTHTFFQYTHTIPPPHSAHETQLLHVATDVLQLFLQWSPLFYTWSVWDSNTTQHAPSDPPTCFSTDDVNILKPQRRFLHTSSRGERKHTFFLQFLHLLQSRAHHFDNQPLVEQSGSSEGTHTGNFPMKGAGRVFSRVRAPAVRSRVHFTAAVSTLIQILHTHLPLCVKARLFRRIWQFSPAGE